VGSGDVGEEPRIMPLASVGARCPPKICGIPHRVVHLGWRTVVSPNGSDHQPHRQGHRPTFSVADALLSGWIDEEGPSRLVTARKPVFTTHWRSVLSFLMIGGLVLISVV